MKGGPPDAGAVAPNPVKIPFAGRDLAFDILRALAVVGMIGSHTSRLIVTEERRAWSVGVLLLEPLIPCLFLFLVGASLVHSLHHRPTAVSRAAWWRKQAGRAFWLWLIAVGFALAENGFIRPDTLLAGGILATIAAALLLFASLLAPPFPFGVTLLLTSLPTLAGLFAYIHLDRLGVRAFPWNAGNSPYFPLLLFCGLGLLYGGIGRLLGHLAATRLLLGRGLLFVLGLSLFLLCLFRAEGLKPLFSKPLGRSDASRYLDRESRRAETLPQAVVQPGEKPQKRIAYYGIRPLLAVAIMGLAAASHALLSLLSPFLQRAAPLFALGRHSLPVYLFHLMVLALVVVAAGRKPFGAAWQGDAMVLFLVIMSHFLALGLERRRGRGRAALARAG